MNPIALVAYESHAPFRVEVDVAGGQPGSLEVTWRVSGPLRKLAMNPLSGRADKLWLDTVFEVFGRFGDADAYWETNLSPQGQWNSYAFDAYRKGMRQTDGVVVCDLQWISADEGFWHFVSKYRYAPQSPALHLGLCAIIHPGPYHYALQHGARPDFHARENFSDSAFCSL